jgi:hypothetical protein
VEHSVLAAKPDESAAQRAGEIPCGGSRKTERRLSGALTGKTKIGRGAGRQSGQQGPGTKTESLKNTVCEQAKEIQQTCTGTKINARCSRNIARGEASTA